VTFSVPGDAAFPARRLEQPLALIEADRVYGDARGTRQLFDAVLHEWILAQCYERTYEPATFGDANGMLSAAFLFFWWWFSRQVSGFDD